MVPRKVMRVRNLGCSESSSWAEVGMLICKILSGRMTKYRELIEKSRAEIEEGFMRGFR